MIIKPSIILIKTFIWACFYLLLFSCNQQPRKEKDKLLRIMAASSLRQVVDELCERYQGDSVVRFSVTYAGSGILARQIEYGAQTDIFLSANTDWVDYLEQMGLVYGDVSLIAANEMVIIGKKNLKLDTIVIDERVLALFEKLDRIAIGDPDHVPAGLYAREALESLGIYKKLDDKIIHTKDVRSALRLVELGEADIGLVYSTDAILSDKVKILCVISAQLHRPVYYQGAMLNDRKHVVKFFKYLKGKDAVATWEKYGFKKVELSSP